MKQLSVYTYSSRNNHTIKKEIQKSTATSKLPQIEILTIDQGKRIITSH